MLTSGRLVGTVYATKLPSDCSTGLGVWVEDLHMACEAIGDAFGSGAAP